jgi:hypothetical protein
MALAINGTRFYGMSFGCRLDTVDVQLAVRETEGGKWEARSAIFETGWRDVPTCESFSFIPPKRSIMLRPVAPPAPRVLVDAAAEHGLMWTAAVDRDKWPQCVPGKADVEKKPDVGWHVTARLTTRRRICPRVLETKVLVPAIVPSFIWKFDHFQARPNSNIVVGRDLCTLLILEMVDAAAARRAATGLILT